MIEGLRQWAFALVLTAMAGSVAIAVSNSPGMKKYIRFTCALVALAVMVAPISSLFRGLPDIFNTYNDRAAVYEPGLEFNLRQLITDKSAEILARRISLMIEQKTGIKPENIYIYSNINNNTEADAHIKIEIEKIIINMPELADTENITENMSAIQAYLKEILDCEIIIE